MIEKVEPISSKDFSKGLVTRSDIIKADPNQSPNTMDVKWNFDGSIQKRLGSSTTNTVIVGSTSLAGWTIDSNGTLSTNISAYWKLDETAGTRADQFGTVNLSDYNSVTSITGIRGNAALFTAANSQALVRATTAPIQTGNVNFSMAGWFYLNSTSTTVERTVISKKDPEIDSPTVLLLHCDGTNGSTSFPDASPSAKTMTANGTAQVDTSQSQFGGASAKFDGVDGTFISTPDNADFDFGTGDFTIDFWHRPANTSNGDFVAKYTSSGWGLFKGSSGTTLRFIGGGSDVSVAWTPSANTWYHVEVTRVGSSMRFFIDGTQQGTTQTVTAGAIDGATTTLKIGHNNNANLSNAAVNGWMDEVRITKGVARHTANFTRPAKAYGVQEFEYWLYVNTNNNATFRVSSTGTNQTATVQATSIGALNTSTWYRVVAWHSNNSHIGIDINLSVNTTNYTSGVRVGSAPFVLGAKSNSLTALPTTFMDGRIDEVGFWSKVLSLQERSDLYSGGSGNTYSAGASNWGWGMFDFGASSIRWLTVAAGTGLYASSNLGATFVVIATSRTQNYQYLDRSRNVLIATSDSYDVPLYWAGSAGTFAATLAPNSAPAVKFSVNYQGFLILLNSSARKRGFFYADDSLQITDPWTNSFDIPSSADDEITAAFILSKFLYVSTRYRLYRVAYIGGNPDWSYLKLKDWGFVPRTVKIVSLKGGQVAVGMDWTRRLRVFDGYDDVFISDTIENDNKMSDFAMSKVSYAGSGLVVSHAELDRQELEYRLNVAIGAQSTQTTHAIILNTRTNSFYPYSNQNFQATAMAESANQLFLMAVDRSGFVHILNSGNRDVATAINEVYDSPLFFKDFPETVSKINQLNLFFAPGSNGTIYFQDRVDFSNTFSSMKALGTELKATESNVQLIRTVDIPSVQNTYQFRFTSSAGTANSWKLTHYDLLQAGLGIGKGV